MMISSRRCVQARKGFVPGHLAPLLSSGWSGSGLSPSKGEEMESVRTYGFTAHLPTRKYRNHSQSPGNTREKGARVKHLAIGSEHQWVPCGHQQSISRLARDGLSTEDSCAHVTKMDVFQGSPV